MLPLFRRSPKPTITALYGAIVAQARHAEFYQNFAVPDTVLARFDMSGLRNGIRPRMLRARTLVQRRCALRISS